MVRVIEYIKKRKYEWNTKVGRQWRLKGKSDPRKEGKVAEGGKPRVKKKKKRYQLGTVVLCEIRQHQISIAFLIRKLPFARGVKGVTQQIWANLRISSHGPSCSVAGHRGIFV